jgi:dihydroorotase (homodimeric type)
MPNLNPPVRGCEDALAYRERIMAALPPGCDFEPLMTLYLTDNTRVEDIEAASASPFIHGAKLYPAGATTNSDFGVTDLSKLGRVFEAMQQHGFMLQLHGEATAPEVDVFDREKVFIEQSLERIRRDFPELRIVFEHITTRDAVDYVRAADTNLGTAWRWSKRPSAERIASSPAPTARPTAYRPRSQPAVARVYTRRTARSNCTRKCSIWLGTSPISNPS